MYKRQAFLEWVSIGSLALTAATALIPFVAASMLMCRRQHGQRMSAINDVCRDAGWLCVVEPMGDVRDAAWAEIGHLHAELRTRGEGVYLVVDGDVDGRPFAIIEHRCRVTNGRMTKTVNHVIAVTSCPDEWPTVTLSNEARLHWLSGLVGLEQLEVSLGNPSFDARWRVRTTDAEFAADVLSPDAQNLVEQAPSEETWEIGHGRICCIRKGSLFPHAVESLALRVTGFRRKLPKSLDEWTAVKRSA